MGSCSTKEPSSAGQTMGTARGAKATFNGVVIAETKTFEIVDGNIYFPMDSLIDREKHFEESALKTDCSWKGTASYYNIKANGDTVENQAWVYKNPKEKAKNIANHVAFYRGQVQVEKY